MFELFRFMNKIINRSGSTWTQQDNKWNEIHFSAFRSLPLPISQFQSNRFRISSSTKRQWSQSLIYWILNEFKICRSNECGRAKAKIEMIHEIHIQNYIIFSFRWDKKRKRDGIILYDYEQQASSIYCLFSWPKRNFEFKNWIRRFSFLSCANNNNHKSIESRKSNTRKNTDSKNKTNWITRHLKCFERLN